MARDGKDPRARGGLTAIATQRGGGANVGLLREVVRGLLVDERGAEAPDVGVARVDEALERSPVAGARRVREPRELVHGGHLTRGRLSAVAPMR